MIRITQHAFDRAKERLKLNNEAFKRLTAMAFCFGIQKEETRGKLRKYVDERCFEHPHNDIRIYGENIFIFKEDALITVFQIPFAVRKNIVNSKVKSI